MVDIYLDGADWGDIKRGVNNMSIKGFTTNPSLMKQSGIRDYRGFVEMVLSFLKSTRSDCNISFEVFADDTKGMIRQGEILDKLSKEYNYTIYVKIPVTNTEGHSTAPVLQVLSDQGIRCNVTAVFTLAQFRDAMDALNPATPSIISIFAGRIADSGRDPVPIMKDAVHQRSLFPEHRNLQILWASSREVYNYIQASQANVDIITMPMNLIDKLNSIGKDLLTFSLETVKMFHTDAVKSGYSL